jgi:NAD(P)-dependent dehydrogenase (short-subunit alcohol dehydrogenase family)
MKVAIVTGSARGIGAAVAEQLTQEGYAVVGLDTAYNSTPGLPTAPAPGVYPISLDITDRRAVHDTVRAVRREIGGLHLVVNNAIWIRYAPLRDFDETTVDSMLAVGLKAVVWLSQAAAEHMADDGGGAIVNIASPAALLGIPGAAIYSAVKGAVVSLTRQNAVELAPLGIRVNAVAPNFTPTPGALSIVDEAGITHRRDRTPLGRLTEPEDVAHAVAYLASEKAALITGQLLCVDGGLTVSL